MRNATGVLGLRRVNGRVADRRIASGRKAAHGRSGCVGGRLFKVGARHFVLHAHDLRAIAGGGVVAAGDEGGSGHGDIGVGHGHGRVATDFLALDGVNWDAGAVAHAGRIDRGGRVGGGMRGGPRVGELGGIVMIDIVEAHAAILAVLVFNDHRHGAGSRERDREVRRSLGIVRYLVVRTI